MRKFFLVVFIFLAVHSVAYGNMLTNPGFESGEDSWYNWDDGTNTNSGIISSQYNHQGVNSACRQVAGQGVGGFGQITPVNPGDAVKANVWVMSPNSEPLANGSEAYLRIEFWNDTEPLKFGHAESEHLVNPTSWKILEVTATVPVGAKEARVLGFTRGSNPSSKGKACFDDFEVNIEKSK